MPSRLRQSTKSQLRSRKKLLRKTPEVPEKKGYTFTGWESKDGVPYAVGDRVTEDLVLTAVYMTNGNYKDSVRIFFRGKEIYYVADELGNGGEESTFTVSALRTIGIPARQVYTPRWAHTDDNHAWVEAWVDGKWYFLGACPEPRMVQ